MPKKRTLPLLKSIVIIRYGAFHYIICESNESVMDTLKSIYRFLCDYYDDSIFSKNLSKVFPIEKKNAKVKNVLKLLIDIQCRKIKTGLVNYQLLEEFEKYFCVAEIDAQRRNFNLYLGTINPSFNCSLNKFNSYTWESLMKRLGTEIKKNKKLNWYLLNY